MIYNLTLILSFIIPGKTALKNVQHCTVKLRLASPKNIPGLYPKLLHPVHGNGKKMGIIEEATHRTLIIWKLKHLTFDPIHTYLCYHFSNLEHKVHKFKGAFNNCVDKIRFVGVPKKAYF